MRAMRRAETTGPRIEAYQLKAVGKKRCSCCHDVKTLEEFNFRRKDKDWRKDVCRVCEAAKFKAYYSKDRDRLIARAKVHYRTHYLKYRDSIFELLGHSCSCCGEREKDFLTVDHINGDGKHQRTKTGQRWGGWAIWRVIRVEAEPKKRFRILCFNCNCGRERSPDKICPHQKERRRLELVS